MNLKGKRILILQQRNWGSTIGSFLAGKLAEEGCILAALTLKRTTDKEVREQTAVKYEKIIGNDAVMEDPLKYLGADRYSMEEICDALGVDTIWPIVITLRNHVRSYADKYYYSYLRKIPDEEILLYVQAVYKYIKLFIDEFKPDAIIGVNYVALPHIMLNLYAMKRGIPMIAVTDSKVSGIYMFTNSYRDDKGQFYDHVDALNSGRSTSMNLKKAETYITEFRQTFKYPHNADRSKKRLWKRIKYHLKPYAEIYYFYRYPQINGMKNLGVTIDYRPPRIIFRDYLAHTRNRYFLDAFKYPKIPKQKPYAYFPLQFQPESNIDAVSPFYNNQLDLARQFALALPGDHILMVKEHPEMIGRRSPSFYKKLSRTPNVYLVDHRISSEEILKDASIILSINGTALAEAAFLNKPAIQVGDLGTTQKLPNVWRHTDMTTLPRKIKEVLKTSLVGDEYERRLLNFVAAAYDTGFPASYFDIVEWIKNEENHEPLWKVCQKELSRVFSLDNAT